MNEDNRWIDVFGELNKAVPDTKSSKELRTILVNYEYNKNWIKQVAYERVEDLALYVALKDPENQKYCVVTTDSMTRCGFTNQQILAQAKTNTAKHYSLENLTDVIFQMYGMSKSPDPVPVWVLTTDDSFYGAGLMGDNTALNKAYKKFGEGFYILPSSIYEILLLPYSAIEDANVNMLKTIVEQVNKETVLVDEQLSNNVYEFDGEKMMLLA